jgi:hypothetical protein
MGDRMNPQHADLASGRWKEMPLVEQMANIGSEISRALNWKNKENEDYSRKAAIRALELIDLSLECRGSFPRLREMARMREAVVDYFFGENEFGSTESLWRSYFDHFNYAAQRSRAR